MSPIKSVEPSGKREPCGLCPFENAEQLAFEHLGGQRGAVERDERRLPPRAELVDRSRHQALARPRLADNQDGDRRRGGRGDLIEQATMRGAEADQGVEPVAGVEPDADLEQFDSEPLRLGVGSVRRGVGPSDQAEQAEQSPRARRGTARTRSDASAVRRWCARSGSVPPWGCPARASGGG